jgi:hypothetical protein
VRTLRKSFNLRDRKKRRVKMEMAMTRKKYKETNGTKI